MSCMGRPKTPSLPKDVIGQLFRDRVMELLIAAFPREKNDTGLYRALAKRSGVGAETIRAAMKGERSPRLVAVDAIARALGTSVSGLLAIDKAGNANEHQASSNHSERGINASRTTR